MSTSRPCRVAVIGGGCAALTAAYELTRPEQQGRFDVTVYQMGWRLGGKGASGRGYADRIEEHGLHLWMGFYENAFRLMRECYQERHAAYPGCRFVSWRDAFLPAPDVGVTDRTPEGWSCWMAHFKPGNGDPGDPTTGDPFTVTAYLRQAVRLVIELLRSAAAMESGTAAGASDSAAHGRRAPEMLSSAFDALLRYGQLATSAAVIEAAELLREVLERFLPQLIRDGAALPLRMTDVLAGVARRRVEQLCSGDAGLRRVWQVIDLILAIIRGSLREGLALDPRGFDAINDHDWRDWLRRHGASEASLDSGFLRGIYDLAFAYEDGDVRKPRLAAGVALRGAMRMFFTYRGALFYRMSAGMGDIVFAPLYQVLAHRGVKFEFFHRLGNVGLAPDAPSVETLTFNVQAHVNGGAAYQPLVNIHNVPCWPAAPDYSQLVDGERLAAEGRAFESVFDQRYVEEKTLHAGRDFDFVVLGVGIGALPHVATELIAREPKWQAMVRHVKTVPTQAFQLWLNQDAAGLGWPHPPANLSGYVPPFDTWADMTHLIPEESWKTPVQSIAYFCGVLPDALNGGTVTEAFYQSQREVVRGNAVGFMNRDLGVLWPKAASNGNGFVWNLLVPDRPIEPGSPPATHLDGQFYTANVNPSDRYVQSLPGSIAHRLSPLDMSFDNLTIAGDWTATGLDTGCVESAVMSGLLASHALSQRPALEEIVGYDHP